MNKFLFYIFFHQKKFALYLRENDEVCFLEVNSKGEYVIPSKEDLKVLNNIYNKKSHFICYEIGRNHSIKNSALYWFLLSSLILSLNSNIQLEERAEVKEYIHITYLTNEKALKENLGERVTVLDLIGAVSDNKNLTNQDRERIMRVVNVLYKKYPDWDFRIFAENIKHLQIRYLNEEQTEEVLKPTLTGNFIFAKQLINISADASEETIYHEICHLLSSFYEIKDNKKLCRTEIIGYALNEAMTSKITSFIIPCSSYARENAVLTYLMAFTDYSIMDYNQTGISILIKELKEKYPDVDIQYIIKTLDLMHDSEIEFSINFTLDKSLKLMDELFLICKDNIDISKDNVYQPFEEFASLFSYVKDTSLLRDYYKKYNEALLNKGYSSIISSDKVDEKIKGLNSYIKFYYDESGIYVYQEPYLIDKRANTICYNKDYHQGMVASVRMDFYLASIYHYVHEIEEPSFLIDVIEDAGILNLRYYQKIPYYDKDKFIGSYSLLDNLSFSIGVTTEGNLSYKIMDLKENKVIYEPIHLVQTSSYKRFNTPEVKKLFFEENTTKLDLSLLFTEFNMKYLINNKIVDDIYINKDKIYFSPIITLKFANKSFGASLDKIGFIYNSGKLLIYPFNVTIPLELNLQEDTFISLKKILEQLDLFYYEDKQYTFTEEELSEMLEEYVLNSVKQTR